MTSEYQFEKWWKSLPDHIPRDVKPNAYNAWLEATRQAYLDAIAICKDEHLHDPVKEHEGDIGYDRAITDCVFSLQARLKELMP